MDFALVAVVGVLSVVILVMAVGGWLEGRRADRFERSAEELGRWASARGMATSNRRITLRSAIPGWVDEGPPSDASRFVSDRFVRFRIDREPDWDRGGHDGVGPVATGVWNDLDLVLFVYWAMVDGVFVDRATVAGVRLPKRSPSLVLTPGREVSPLDEGDGLQETHLRSAWQGARCFADELSPALSILTAEVADEVMVGGRLRHWIEIQGTDLLVAVTTTEPAGEIEELVKVASVMARAVGRR